MTQHEERDGQGQEARVAELVGLEAAWERRGLSRRGFVRLLLAGASTATIAGVLAACGDAAPTATSGAPSPPPASAPPTIAATKGATTSAATSAAPRAATGAIGTATATTSTATRAVGAPGGQDAAGGIPSGGKFSTLDPVGKKGGHITQIDFGDAKTMNPMLVGDTSSGARTAVLFNALVDISPDTGLPYPDLATAVPTQQNGGISPDGLTYTFTLRKGVKFSDGIELTAKDVLYTYNTMMKKESTSPRTSQLNERIEAITAPDDSTVVFKLKSVVASFLIQNMYGIVPEHILKEVPVDKIKDHPFSTGDPKATIGTGPFKFQEWVKDDHTTLVKNPGYFKGEPALDQYIFKVVKDANVVVAGLKTGEGDYGGVSPALYNDVVKEASLNVQKFDAYGFTYYYYQLDPAKTTLFQDKKVRQALLYGLNREAMVQAILNNLGVVAQGTMPVPSYAYQPDKLKTKYGYDPRKAEQLLDEAGWKKGADGVRAKDGQRLSFTLWTNAGNTTRENYVTAMQQQWKQIGVEANPKTEEWNAFLSRLDPNHDFEIALLGFSWGVDPDQSTMFKTGGGFNDNKYSNPEVDKLLDQGVKELDPQKRAALYLQMQDLILDDLPTVIIDFPQTTAAVNKRVHNLKPNPINIRWNVHTWWVEDGK